MPHAAFTACSILLAVIPCSLALAGDEQLPEATDAKVDFRADVEPILREHCHKCHGAKRQKGGLRLDSRQSALRGGDSGKVVLPGKSAESRLIRLVAGVDPGDVMPPSGDRLAPRQIGVLRAWIDQGARWPDERDSDAAQPERIASDHWSLTPLARPTPPVADASWAQSPIDLFVLARLRERGLSPNPPADRATLIRRLSFDLLGLPPSPEEVDAFVRDEDPHAYEMLVDRLLASPHYGERWARHWLDVARYTESQGFEYDRLRPNAWQFRDYVIRAFNEDKPYDQFVREQIAGDVLGPVTSDGIIATSFLVCGAWDQAGNSQKNQTQRMITREEEMEDLVSVVCQTFLGMTVNCARCHSHKFDPIPQTDYYRIKSVFDGVKHGERSFESDKERRTREERSARLRGEIDRLSREIAAIESRARTAALAARETKTGDAASKPPAGPQPLATWTFDDGTARDAVGSLHGTLHGGAKIERGRLVVNGTGAVLRTSPITTDIAAKTLEAWVVLPTLDHGGGGAITLETNDGGVFDSVVYAERQPRKWMAGSNGFVRTRDRNSAPAESAGPGEIVHVATVYNENGTIALFRNGEPYGEPYRVGNAPQHFEKGGARVLLGQRHTGGGRAFFRGEIDRAALYDRALSREEIAASAASTGNFVSFDEVLTRMSDTETARREKALARREALLDELRSLPRSDATTYAGTRVQPPPTHRLVKGNVKDRAEVVTPGALSVISSPSGDFDLAANAPEADRRIAFARWVADPGNPLTARVMANRVWHYHFGRGIVGTPNDFGAMGQKPTHPELLDWLARQFVEGGWHLKRLHRLILLSSTYRQSSSFREDAAAVDADNRLLWRFSPRRLEAEAVRDAMLAISGRLNLRRGGPSFQPFTVSSFGSTFYTVVDRDEPELNRRTVYRMNVNSGKDPLLDCFDCPEPSVKTPRRRSTTTPLQALSLMNSSFVNRQARLLAERVRGESPGSTVGAIDRAYRHALSRDATDQERAEALALVGEHGLEPLCWVLLNTSEFLYVR